MLRKYAVGLTIVLLINLLVVAVAVLRVRDTLILSYIYQDCDWQEHQARVLGSDFSFRECILP